MNERITVTVEQKFLLPKRTVGPHHGRVTDSAGQLTLSQPEPTPDTRNEHTQTIYSLRM